MAAFVGVGAFGGLALRLRRVETMAWSDGNITVGNSIRSTKARSPVLSRSVLDGSHVACGRRSATHTQGTGWSKRGSGWKFDGNASDNSILLMSL